MSFTPFPLMITSCKAIMQYHNHDIDLISPEHIPRILTLPLCRDTPFCLVLFPFPLVIINLLSIFIILSFQECHMNGIKQYATYWDWCFLLVIIPWRFTHISFLLRAFPWYGSATILCLTINL